jgi:hypothetical protein
MMILLNLVIICGAVVLVLILAATVSRPDHTAAAAASGELRWKKPSLQTGRLLMHETPADVNARTAHVAAAGMQ